MDNCHIKLTLDHGMTHVVAPSACRWCTVNSYFHSHGLTWFETLGSVTLARGLDQSDQSFQSIKFGFSINQVHACRTLF
jgi:hypothetical protein